MLPELRVRADEIGEHGEHEAAADGDDERERERQARRDGRIEPAATNAPQPAVTLDRLLDRLAAASIDAGDATFAAGTSRARPTTSAPAA